MIQPMKTLQTRIPLPSLLPKGWLLIVIDLKDCFFTMSLQEKKEKIDSKIPTHIFKNIFVGNYVYTCVWVYVGVYINVSFHRC